MSRAADLERVRERLAEWREWLEGDPGARAEMRRAATVGDAMMTRAFAELAYSVNGPRPTEGGAPDHGAPSRLAALARTALVLARMPPASPVAPAPRVAEAMGRERRGRTEVGPIRAEALFRSADADEACRSLCGIAGQVGACDPGDVYLAMLRWDAARQEWAMRFNLAAVAMKRAAAASKGA